MSREQVMGLFFVQGREKSERGKHAKSVLVRSNPSMTTGQPQMDTSPPSIPSDFRYWSQRHRLYAIRALSCEVPEQVPFRIFREISPSMGIKEVREYFRSGRMLHVMGNLDDFLRPFLGGFTKITGMGVSNKDVCVNFQQESPSSSHTHTHTQLYVTNTQFFV